MSSAIQSDLGVEASQISFWDDSPQHVDGALRAGWKAYLYEGNESITGVLEDNAGVKPGE